MNVAQCFGGFGNSSYLRGMEHGKFIITGVNKLTKQRDQLSRAMSENEANERLQREVAARKSQRYQPYTRLRVERLEAVQLKIQFKDYE